MKKLILVPVLVSFLISPLAAVAQTTDIAALEATIALVEAQLATLKAQLAALKGQATATTQTSASVSASATGGALTSFLERGARGAEVKSLQAALLLAGSDVLTLDEITDYFGPQTEAAVKKFQTKNGISAVGYVGPSTRAALNALFAKYPVATENGRLCAKLSAGASMPSGWIGKYGTLLNTCGGSSVASVPAVSTYVAPQPVMPTPVVIPQTANTTDAFGSDIGGPVISNIISANATPSSIQVTWNTDNRAKSQVYWSSVTPVTVGQGGNGILSENTPYVTGHNVSVYGLSAGQKYYYKVVSIDEAGRRTVSGENSFKTQCLDTGPLKMLQEPQAIEITQTSAKIFWRTEGESTSRVRYSTVSPIPYDNRTLITEDKENYVTDHYVLLTGLTPGKRYFYNTSAVNCAMNTVNSSNFQDMFDTLP